MRQRIKAVDTPQAAVLGPPVIPVRVMIGGETHFVEITPHQEVVLTVAGHEVRLEASAVTLYRKESGKPPHRWELFYDLNNWVHTDVIRAMTKQDAIRMFRSSHSDKYCRIIQVIQK